MNKKTLFLILLGIVLVLPSLAAAASAKEMADAVATLATNIGLAIVVIGWIIAGILYLLSMGSPEKTGTAKKALIAAVIGTVLVVIAEGGYAMIKGLITPITGGG